MFNQANPSGTPKARPDRRSLHRIGAMLRHWPAMAAAHIKQRRRAPAPSRNLAATLRTWHQRAGLFAFIFLIWLGVSGFLINQSSRWGYDTVRIDWPWLTSLYGIKAAPPAEGFASDGHWITTDGEHLLLDGNPTSHRVDTIVGMATGQLDPSTPLLFVATRQALLALTPDAQLIDEMRPPALPLSEIQRIGMREDSIVLAGDEMLRSTDAGMTWSPTSAEGVEWSEPVTLSEAQQAAVAPHSRPSMSVERILVDSHSGQIFGSYGVWVMNGVAFITVILGISGVWMTLRTSFNRRKRQRAAASAARPGKN